MVSRIETKVEIRAQILFQPIERNVVSADTLSAALTWANAMQRN